MTFQTQPIAGGFPLETFWAMEARALAQVEQVMANITSAPARAATFDAPERAPMSVGSDGVAVIDVTGPLQVNRTILTRYLGGSIHGEVQADVERAATDPNVRGVVMFIDSPGGTVSGTSELAAAVAKLSAAKPVVTYSPNILASAAYWIASQTRAIVAGPTAIVGSVGTRTTLFDTSKMAEAMGVGVHPIASAPAKALGTPGTAMTDEWKAQAQRLINGLNAQFLNAVKTGRKSSEAQANVMARGDVYVATEATTFGMIDKVGTEADARAMLASMMGRSTATTTTRASVGTFTSTPAAGIQMHSAGSSPMPPAIGQVQKMSRADAKAQAKREWDSNVENCQQNWGAEQYFVAYRAHELAEGKAAAGPTFAEPALTPQSTTKTRPNDAQATQVAEAEWKANTGNCQQNFKGNQAAFLAYRRYELRNAHRL
jgi:signal peptide peptidase SppA